MLDPKEQKKGGFGAFVQRDRERREEAAKGTTSSGDAAPASPSSGDTAANGTAPGTPDKA
jgi:hypothetical protein